MAALPLAQTGMDINLPLEVSPVKTQTVDTRQIVAEYTADHRLTVNKQEVPIETAERFLRDTFETRTEKTLFIIGAGSVAYGEIMRVIDAAGGAGVTKIGIVTEGMKQEAQGGGAPAGKGK